MCFPPFFAHPLVTVTFRVGGKLLTTRCQGETYNIIFVK